ncbi:Teichoic acids export ATP-binding protein TagH [Stieleria bergensis]|uniref:Teichoic acids export ATP-binding protein TagH n=1 Tax=Stieleria bergensis TaxID=2528025 RepID=A0A517SXP2_9BACT|nr:Teichoic acids export ATP-binding protein TagH [Planctomycetes bacterium SV_7m_r]
MSPIISVENLSKAYRIGAKEEVPDTLVGAAKGILKAPFKNLSRLRGLDTSASSDEGSGSESDILWALKDVSFEVNEGDVVGIIGRNGAGKSTLLKVLSRITEPTSGRAVIRGRVSSLLEVGTGFHPELTGRENVYMNGTILGMTKKEIDRKFDEIVDFSEIEKFLDTPAKRYSSGMQVRLAFAVAAHLDPEILIVDEVLAVGDLEFQKKCLGKMKRVSRSGRTVLFVSHNIPMIEQLCTRGIALKNGGISAVGTVPEALADYCVSSVSSRYSTESFNETSDQIRGIDLRDALGNSVSSIQCGDSLKIIVDYRLNSIVEKHQCCIEVNDSLDRKLFTIGSFLSGEVNRGESCSKVVGTLPSVDLAPGTYTMKVRIGTLARNVGECTVADHISFEVKTADYYGGLRAPDSFRGPMLARSSWVFSE